jgi:hypothetical protein
MAVTATAYPGIERMAMMEALAGPLTFLPPVRAVSIGFIEGGGRCGA